MDSYPSFGLRGVKETPAPARRNKYKPEFKAKVAIEALKGDKSIAELAQIYGVHPAQISTWKKQLLDNGTSAFEAKGAKADDVSVDVDALEYSTNSLPPVPLIRFHAL